MLLSGSPPFSGIDNDEVLAAVMSGYWEFNRHFNHVSLYAKNFILKCLTKVSNRISAEEALKHPWFQLLEADDAQSGKVSPDVVARLNGENQSKVFAPAVIAILYLFKYGSCIVCSAFSSRRTLSQLCLEVVVHTLEPNQVEDLRAEFKRLDSTGTGEISYADIRGVFRREGLSEVEADNALRSIDYNHGGVINYHEFLAATVSRARLREENLRLAFERISNHNEYFTCNELQALLNGDSSTKQVLL